MVPATVALSYSIIMALVGGSLYRSRGGLYSSGFLLGLFLGIIGVLYTAFARPSYAFQECPECAEEVRAEATRCRFCGHVFSDEDDDQAQT